jgi:hypothetical protein
MIELFFVQWLESLEKKVTDLQSKLVKEFTDFWQRFLRSPWEMPINFGLMFANCIDHLLNFTLAVRLTFLTTALIVLVRQWKIQPWMNTKVITVESAVRAIPELFYLWSLEGVTLRLPFWYRAYKKVKWLNELIKGIEKSEIWEYIKGFYLKRVKLWIKLVLTDIFFLCTTIALGSFFIFLHAKMKDRKRFEFILGTLSQDNPKHTEDGRHRTREE